MDRRFRTVIGLLGLAAVIGLAVPAFLGCARDLNTLSPRRKATAARTYTREGDGAFARGRYVEALADYSEAIRIDPTYARPFWQRGRIYLACDVADKADADFAQARELEPGFENLSPEPLPIPIREVDLAMIAPPDPAADEAPEEVPAVEPDVEEVPPPAEDDPDTGGEDNGEAEGAGEDPTAEPADGE